MAVLRFTATHIPLKQRCPDYCLSSVEAHLSTFLTMYGVCVKWQDFEYLQLYTSLHGREAALSLLDKTGMYNGPERYTIEHGPIESLRGEVYRTFQPIT